jgi:hypothetical protein
MAGVKIMTASSGSDEKEPGNGGKEQRPYATLDLTAKEVPSKDKPAQDAAGDEKPASASEDPPSPESEAAEAAGDTEAEPHHPLTGYGLVSFATHLAAGVIGAVLALIFAYFLFADREPAGFSPEQAQALRAQIGSAEAKVTDLEDALRRADRRAEQLQTAAGETERLKQDVAGLSQRLSKVEARPAAGGATQETVQQSLDPLTARLAALESRVETIAKTQSEMQTDSKATALALALYNLRRAANEGRPFASELKSVAGLSPVPLDLGALEKRRDQGVPSLEQLQASFDSASNAALDAELHPASNSFASELWAKLRSFIRIKRKGDVPGDSTQAILARTEHRLEGEDLRAALSEAEQLKGSAAEAMKPWIGELKARIAAEDALAQMEAKLLTALGGENTGKRGG